MKNNIPTYVYCNREFIGKFNSEREAAHKAGCNVVTVSRIVSGEQTMTRQGYVFTDKPLTDQQIEELPIPHKLHKLNGGLEFVDGRSCRKRVEQQEFEVSCKDQQVLFLAKDKQERIQHFKIFLYHILKERWNKVPRSIGTLERQYIKEFLQSI